MITVTGRNDHITFVAQVDRQPSKNLTHPILEALRAPDHCQHRVGTLVVYCGQLPNILTSSETLHPLFRWDWLL